MDTQTLINGAIWIAIAIGGWFAREVWGAVKELQRDIHQIEVDLPSNYVRRDEFSEAIRRIELICERIFDKIEAKQDK
jgi:hypothetical protein